MAKRLPITAETTSEDKRQAASKIVAVFGKRADMELANICHARDKAAGAIVSHNEATAAEDAALWIGMISYGQAKQAWFRHCVSVLIGRERGTATLSFSERLEYVKSELTARVERLAFASLGFNAPQAEADKTFIAHTREQGTKVAYQDTIEMLRHFAECIAVDGLNDDVTNCS